MNPGVTHFPLASTRMASAGMLTLLPTAAIFPSRIKTVALGSFGPETGYTVPPVIAMVCAWSGAAASRTIPTSKRLPTVVIVPPPARSARY